MVEAKKQKRKTDSTVEVSVIVDVNEKIPWEFDIKLPSKFSITEIYRDKLPAGDYTIIGHEMSHGCRSVLIERKKDLIEFIGNIGNKNGWRRFQNELEIMSDFYNPTIVIEDDLMDIYKRINTKRGRDKYLNVSPTFIMKRVSEIHAKYGVSTVFSSNRNLAQYYACNLFKYTVISDELDYECS